MIQRLVPEAAVLCYSFKMSLEDWLHSAVLTDFQITSDIALGRIWRPSHFCKPSLIVCESWDYFRVWVIQYCHLSGFVLSRNKTLCLFFFFWSFASISISWTLWTRYQYQWFCRIKLLDFSSGLGILISISEPKPWCSDLLNNLMVFILSCVLRQSEIISW